MKELKILKGLRVIGIVWAVSAFVLTCFGIGTWQWTACNLYMIGVGVYIINMTLRDYKRKVGRFVRHYNTWWWGRSVTVIAYDGTGMVELCIDDKHDDWGFINSLMVEPRQRRNGLGTALLLECQWRIEWYAKMGYELDEEDYGEGAEFEYRMYKMIET